MTVLKSQVHVVVEQPCNVSTEANIKSVSVTSDYVSLRGDRVGGLNLGSLDDALAVARAVMDAVDEYRAEVARWQQP